MAPLRIPGKQPCPVPTPAAPRLAQIPPSAQDGEGTAAASLEMKRPRDAGPLFLPLPTIRAQKLYSASRVKARPRGSAMRGSQAAPAAKSFWCAVNGGSVSSRFFTPRPSLSLSMPVQVTL